MEKILLPIRLALATNPTPLITCENFQNGRCIARRTCRQILAGTQDNDSPIVEDGRRVAKEIVAHGATFEKQDGTCSASSQEEARRCNGFIM